MAKFEEDNVLQFEADKSGMIHVRKKKNESQVLEGYGTTEFGISAYEPKKIITTPRILAVAGIAAAGLLAWNFRLLTDYALLLRESSRS